jgi:hypothetical protein
MKRAHVIRLNPTPEQEFSHLGQAFDNDWRMKKEQTLPRPKHPRKDGEEGGFLIMQAGGSSPSQLRWSIKHHLIPGELLG